MTSRSCVKSYCEGHQNHPPLLEGELIFQGKTSLFSFGSASDYETVKVPVNHGLSTAQSVKLGNYNEVHRGINNKFFPDRNGKEVITNITLLPGNVHEPFLYSGEIIDAARHRYRPAVFAELLAIGQYYPKLQEVFWVIALGQTANIDNIPWAPFLCGNHLQRDLHLQQYNMPWNNELGLCRFPFIEVTNDQTIVPDVLL